MFRCGRDQRATKYKYVALTSQNRILIFVSSVHISGTVSDHKLNSGQIT